MVADHFCRRLLTEAGINPERFTLDWASAAEAPLYVALITKFTEKLKELGPLGTVEGLPIEALKLRLDAAKAAAESKKLRTRLTRLTIDLRQDNDYSAEAIEAKMADKLNKAISRAMENS